MTRRVLLLAFLLTLAPILTAAEDFSGIWTGSFTMTIDGQTQDESAYLILKQKGTELTGSGGPNEEKQWEISKGKVDGAKVEFDVQSDGPLIHFALKLVEGRLQGDASAEFNGQKMTGVVDLQRKKD